MRIALAALFLPILILTNRSNVKGQDWRQIVPLKSTRADVERLLGPTKEPYFAVYHLKVAGTYLTTWLSLSVFPRNARQA